MDSKLPTTFATVSAEALARMNAASRASWRPMSAFGRALKAAGSSAGVAAGYQRDGLPIINAMETAPLAWGLADWHDFRQRASNPIDQAGALLNFMAQLESSGVLADPVLYRGAQSLLDALLLANPALMSPHLRFPLVRAGFDPNVASSISCRHLSVPTALALSRFGRLPRNEHVVAERRMTAFYSNAVVRDALDCTQPEDGILSRPDLAADTLQLFPVRPSKRALYVPHSTLALSSWPVRPTTPPELGGDTPTVLMSVAHDCNVIFYESLLRANALVERTRKGPLLPSNEPGGHLRVRMIAVGFWRALVRGEYSQHDLPTASLQAMLETAGAKAAAQVAEQIASGLDDFLFAPDTCVAEAASTPAEPRTVFDIVRGRVTAAVDGLLALGLGDGKLESRADAANWLLAHTLSRRRSEKACAPDCCPEAALGFLAGIRDSQGDTRPGVESPFIGEPPTLGTPDPRVRSLADIHYLLGPGGQSPNSIEALRSTAVAHLWNEALRAHRTMASMGDIIKSAASPRSEAPTAPSRRRAL